MRINLASYRDDASDCWIAATDKSTGPSAHRVVQGSIRSYVAYPTLLSHAIYATATVQLESDEESSWGGQVQVIGNPFRHAMRWHTQYKPAERLGRSEVWRAGLLSSEAVRPAGGVVVLLNVPDACHPNTHPLELHTSAAAKRGALVLGNLYVPQRAKRTIMLALEDGPSTRLARDVHKDLRCCGA